MIGRKVLVTGASGFIGRRVVRMLAERGDEVHAVGRTPPAQMSLVVRWYQTDLLDPAQTRSLLAAARPHSLIHLAWTATPGRFWTDPDNLDWVAASLVLTRAFADAGGQRALFAGTCAEYDWGHAVLDEATTPLRPATLYGTAKNALRSMLEPAAGPLGLSLTWGRIFFLYGPDEAPRRLVSDIIAGIAEGKPVLCSAGTQRRDFMHVDDVAAALVALLDSNVNGPVNIASGACVPLRDVIMRLAHGLGRPDLIRLGARPMQPGEPPELRATISLLRDRVGFTPRFTLEEGIEAICAATPTRLADGGTRCHPSPV